ncbi:MAG: S-formylglutathione hydrolase [Neomegalonema sp.]
METVSSVKCFGGEQGVYRHASAACGVDMTFGLYMPPAAADGPVPLLWYLSGLTCTHENAMTKAGAQGWCAQHGVAIVFPDTSPRGDGVADDESYDLGQGAGFYVDSTQAPWAPHFSMRSYILNDLTNLLAETFPLDMARQGITGHSMGGHGALTMAMSEPDRFGSVSAFAPISNPTGADWGRKQLSAYLGSDEAAWSAFDASLLLRSRGWKGDILIDQGDADPFLELLRPQALVDAISETGQAATHRMQPGYDHSYFFVASFMEDHVAWHAERLKNLD